MGPQKYVSSLSNWMTFVFLVSSCTQLLDNGLAFGQRTLVLLVAILLACVPTCGSCCFDSQGMRMGTSPSKNHPTSFLFSGISHPVALPPPGLPVALPPGLVLVPWPSQPHEPLRAGPRLWPGELGVDAGGRNVAWRSAESVEPSKRTPSKVGELLAMGARDREWPSRSWESTWGFFKETIGACKKRVIPLIPQPCDWCDC